MSELLDLSSRVVDSGRLEGPVNRMTHEAAEVGDGLVLVESFSHVVALRTADGLVCFDTSSAMTGAAVVAGLRRWSTEPVSTVVYTHGHVDHVGGSGAFVADARARGHRDPAVVAHEAVPRRFARYDATDGWNKAINARQFGPVRSTFDLAADDQRFLPADVARPTATFDHRLQLRVGDELIELHHARGETDDHVWAWLPERRTVCSGDFLIWFFPNAGNPQKVQRYPSEWAAALRSMAALEPELLLPAHGLPIAGRERVRMVLDEVATVLERLVTEVVARMNAGQTLDQIVHEVRVEPSALARPWLLPVYDEPEFVVRNIWRLYGGWWDGNPARLKPPPDAELAAEVARLAGGHHVLLDRAAELAAGGNFRLACQLAEWAAGAAPHDDAVHEVRASVYGRRVEAETSLMAKGVFRTAARDRRRLPEPPPRDEPAP